MDDQGGGAAAAVQVRGARDAVRCGSTIGQDTGAAVVTVPQAARASPTVVNNAIRVDARNVLDSVSRLTE